MKTIIPYLLLIIASCTVTIRAQSPLWAQFDATINPSYIFSTDVDTTHGIRGTVGSGGYIQVSVNSKRTGTLIYAGEITASTYTFTATPYSYTKDQLGPGATYYPNVWRSTDLKSSVFGSDRKKYDAISHTGPYDFLSDTMNIAISVKYLNSTIEYIRIPGIGVFNLDGKNLLFDICHFCSNLVNSGHPACAEWSKMKYPRMNVGSDLSIAAHRGRWGDNIGRGNPENSTLATEDTKKFTNVVESDVVIMNDNNLIISHDYNLLRESNYAGTDKDYMFNMDYEDIQHLSLKRRNGEVSDQNFLRVKDLLQLLIDNDLVVNLDIKSIIARRGPDGTCIDNCDYDPKTNPDAPQMTMNSWKQIFKGCVDNIRELNAFQYVAFKVPFDYDTLKTIVPEEDLCKLLFMPVIQPNTRDGAIEKACDFVDSWNAKVGKRLVAIETNFKMLSDPFLQPFSRNNVYYSNLLEYVYRVAKVRPGCYPDEPGGPRGVSNRWASWEIKDLSKDIRGDHYQLMNIPFGRIMVLTTDRPDVWLQVETIYDNKYSSVYEYEDN